MNRNNGIAGELLFSVAALIWALYICGCGGGPSQLGMRPGPQSRVISVVLSPLSPSVVPGGAISVSASVSNDGAHAGVAWSCTPANACGSFNPPSTASGMAAVYTGTALAPA